MSKTKVTDNELLEAIETIFNYYFRDDNIVESTIELFKEKLVSEIENIDNIITETLSENKTYCEIDIFDYNDSDLIRKIVEICIMGLKLKGYSALLIKGNVLSIEWSASNEDYNKAILDIANDLKKGK